MIELDFLRKIFHYANRINNTDSRDDYIIIENQFLLELDSIENTLNNYMNCDLDLDEREDLFYGCCDLREITNVLLFNTRLYRIRLLELIVFLSLKIGSLIDNMERHCSIGINYFADIIEQIMQENQNGDLSLEIKPTIGKIHYLTSNLHHHMNKDENAMYCLMMANFFGIEMCELYDAIFDLVPTNLSNKTMLAFLTVAYHDAIEYNPKYLDNEKFLVAYLRFLRHHSHFTQFDQILHHLETKFPTNKVLYIWKLQQAIRHKDFTHIDKYYQLSLQYANDIASKHDGHCVYSTCLYFQTNFTGALPIAIEAWCIKKCVRTLRTIMLCYCKLNDLDNLLRWEHEIDTLENIDDEERQELLDLKNNIRT